MKFLIMFIIAVGLMACKTIEVVYIKEPCIIPCMPELTSIGPDDEEAVWCLSIEDVNMLASWLEFLYIEYGGCDE